MGNNSLSNNLMRNFNTCYSKTHNMLVILHGISMAESFEQASFTSEIVGLILAAVSHEKSLSTLCRKSWVFSRHSGFLPQGNLRGWVRMSISIILVVIGH